MIFLNEIEWYCTLLLEQVKTRYKTISNAYIRYVPHNPVSNSVTCVFMCVCMSRQMETRNMKKKKVVKYNLFIQILYSNVRTVLVSYVNGISAFFFKEFICTYRLTYLNRVICSAT